MTRKLDRKDLELNALLEVTQAINSNFPEDDLFRIYKFILLSDLKIEKLVLFTKDMGFWKSKVQVGVDNVPEEYHPSEALLSLTEDQEIHPSQGFEGQFGCVFPVHHKEELLSLVFISFGQSSSKKTRFLKALTNILLVAIENKRLARKQIEQEAYTREMEVARKVQNFLFPKSLPDGERLKVHALYHPHNEVGGDYYDYIKISEDRFLICIADVSGKGVPAALLMSNFQASLRTLIRHSDKLCDIVRDLNYTTRISGNGESFITFFAAIYDFSSCSLEYINCGHNEVFFKMGDETRFLREGTTVLGMFEPLPFIKTETLDNVHSFFLFAYTDGLTETFDENEQAFDLLRLQKILEKGPENAHETIMMALDEFRGTRSFHDDITMLSCIVNNHDSVS